MKKRYLILFIISLYIMQISMFLDFMIINNEIYNQVLEKALFYTSFSFFILSLILGLVNLIFAFTKINDNNGTIKITMISKLVLVPYFIINFLVCALLIAGFAFIFTILSTIILIPLFVLANFLTMLVTSSYNISYLINKFKNKEINLLTFFIHFIFQLVFIGDIIDTIYIYRNNGNMLK